MKVDLSKMSLKQLEAHAGRLRERTSTLRAKEHEKMLRRWKAEDAATAKRREAEAHELGVEVADSPPKPRPAPVKRRRRRMRKSKGKPKFQDPESGLTWTGRGRVPGWVSSHEQGGGSRDDLLIKTAAKPKKARKKRSRK